MARNFFSLLTRNSLSVSSRSLTPGHWPAGIGAAWQVLLDELHSELVALDPDCVIVDARPAEHGALEILFYAPPNVAEQARTLVDSTVDTSRKVCEGCGEPGRLYGGIWSVTCCSQCAP